MVGLKLSPVAGRGGRKFFGGGMPIHTQHGEHAGELTPEQQQVLVQALLHPAVFAHPVGRISLLETHISWVVLTGDYVYKLKKPVNYGFLDFSTLERRHFFCQEELRLNRTFAPDLYLDVVAISGSVEHPVLQGTGAPLEYAVRMRQFPQSGLLSNMALHRELLPSHIDEIAALVATVHTRVGVADAASDYGLPEDVHRWVIENFSHIRPALDDELQLTQLEHLAGWCQQAFEQLRPVLQARRDKGFVRECHGDLHLGNLALVDGCITPFDCIEFNAQLRWIDVISEAAFLVMDIQDRGYPELGWRFLNGYLQFTGDYAGVRLLRYYLVYRALVRAKVAILKCAQAAADVQQAARAEYQAYMDLAVSYADTRAPVLLITHGVSGSGKSWYATQLAERLGAIQLRSDVERKRLHGYRADADTGSGVHSGVYSQTASEQTYARLAMLAAEVIAGGYPVIVDATFLEQAQRSRFRELAATQGVPFVLLHFEADRDTLLSRVRTRHAAATDPSEAGVEVLEDQLASQQPLLAEEQAGMISVDSTAGLPLDDLLGRLARYMKPVR